MRLNSGFHYTSPFADAWAKRHEHASEAHELLARVPTKVLRDINNNPAAKASAVRAVMSHACPMSVEVFVPSQFLV